VHSAQPSEIETPLALLREHSITPKELLFVRNNQSLEGTQKLEPMSLTDWKIEITGLLAGPPRTLAASELESMEQVEHEVVLQCSGNGRAFFSRAAMAKGAQWQNGAMGNVQFKGVPLRAVFDKLKIEPKGEARFVAAEGRDVPGKPGEADFEHSLPLSAVLDRAILALRLNGEPLPAVHGGPVRLVTPGYYGTMNVKWLRRLRLEASESANHHHRERYRTPQEPIDPGSTFKYDLTNSDANWGMRIKSVIFAPLDGQQLKAGAVEVRGVAFNDGVAKIDAVEVSIDGGKRWRRAELEHPGSRYAWHPWAVGLDLPSGESTILARAIDALGRTQPRSGAIHWNPAGYAWNGVHEIRVMAS
jgi:DMSO/TMAO reductase YedYZ molybdopterin-dependent catalytic subunit